MVVTPVAWTWRPIRNSARSRIHPLQNPCQGEIACSVGAKAAVSVAKSSDNPEEALVATLFVGAKTAVDSFWRLISPRHASLAFDPVKLRSSPTLHGSTPTFVPSPPCAVLHRFLGDQVQLIAIVEPSPQARYRGLDVDGCLCLGCFPTLQRQETSTSSKES